MSTNVHFCEYSGVRVLSLTKESSFHDLVGNPVVGPFFSGFWIIDITHVVRLRMGTCRLPFLFVVVNLFPMHHTCSPPLCRMMDSPDCSEWGFGGILSDNHIECRMIEKRFGRLKVC